MTARDLASMLQAMEVGHSSPAEILTVVGDKRDRVLALARLLGCKGQLARLEQSEIVQLTDGLLDVGGVDAVTKLVLCEVDADPTAVETEKEAARLIRTRLQAH